MRGKSLYAAFGLVIAFSIAYSLWQPSPSDDTVEGPPINMIAFTWVMPMHSQAEHQQIPREADLIEKASLRVYQAVHRLCENLSLESWEACVRAQQKLKEAMKPSTVLE